MKYYLNIYRHEVPASPPVQWNFRAGGLIYDSLESAEKHRDVTAEFVTVATFDVDVPAPPTDRCPSAGDRDGLSPRIPLSIEARVAALERIHFGLSPIAKWESAPAEQTAVSKSKSKSKSKPKKGRVQKK